MGISAGTTELDNASIVRTLDGAIMKLYAYGPVNGWASVCGAMKPNVDGWGNRE